MATDLNILSSNLNEAFSGKVVNLEERLGELTMVVKASELLGKIVAMAVETNGHIGFPGGGLSEKAPCSMARRQIAVNPRTRSFRHSARQRHRDASGG